MKFPGKRKLKHYFPVASRQSIVGEAARDKVDCHISGICQTLVDIEAPVDWSLLERYGLTHGTSCLVSDEVAEQLSTELRSHSLIDHEHAGGSIGNTLHNYSILADNRSVLFGVISDPIPAKGDAYRYLCNTSSKVDLDYLQPVNGPIGRCFTLICPDGERTFAFSPGYANQLSGNYINQEIVQTSSALVISAYLMRTQPGDSIDQAAMLAIEYAKSVGVPVVLNLGTWQLIEQDPAWWQEFIREHVSVLAMNEEEAASLTGEKEPLLAAQKALALTDLVLLTAGAQGLYLSGYTDDATKRETSHPVRSGVIADYNRFEFSRPMKKEQCDAPVAVYSHIAPYMGGPDNIKNTNGAGDGALAALLHDIAANDYHRQYAPNSSKHATDGLCYSSFSQICKYANRVSYELLSQHSPRLSNGLPEREDSLEEAYWER